MHDNRIVYNDTGSEFSTAVNVGAETLPNSYSFARNRWLNLANPTPAGSTPSLPTPEVGGVYGGDAMAPTDEAHVWDFAWGKWIVNANATTESVNIADWQSLRRALTGQGSEFKPLQTDPLSGPWTSQALSAATLELAPFSQAILINPTACTNCFGSMGDYNGDGTVDLGDFNTWTQAFGTTVAAVDGSGNGFVDAADYVVWRKASSNTSSALLMANTIPEPGVVAMTTLLLVITADREHRCKER